MKVAYQRGELGLPLDYFFNLNSMVVFKGMKKLGDCPKKNTNKRAVPNPEDQNAKEVIKKHLREDENCFSNNNLLENPRFLLSKTECNARNSYSSETKTGKIQFSTSTLQFYNQALRKPHASESFHKQKGWSEFLQVSHPGQLCFNASRRKVPHQIYATETD